MSARNAFANNLDLPSDDEKLTRPCDEDWMVLAGEFELVKGEPKVRSERDGGMAKMNQSYAWTTNV